MPNACPEQDSTRSNRSSGKLLNIIEHLSLQSEPIRLQDLSKAVGMNESTALRYLFTLINNGYVYQDEVSGRYCLTYKLCAVAANLSNRNSLRNLCAPYLRSLAQIFSESVNVAEENDMEVVYIEAVNGPSQLLMTTRSAGDVSPLHCTAVGKLLLLEFSAQKLDMMIATKGMPSLTKNTLVTKAQLVEELRAVKAQGYALDNEEYETGARCVAVPIYDYTGKVIAGISVSGPVTRMTDSQVFDKLPFLMDASQQISTRMGYQKAIF